MFGSWNTAASGSLLRTLPIVRLYVRISQPHFTYYNCKFALENIDIEVKDQIIGCLKFMVLFFYRRLKADDWRQTVFTVNRLFLIMGLAYLVIFLTGMLGCRPYSNPLPSCNSFFSFLHFTMDTNHWRSSQIPQ
jgi:hypothetical protein